MTVKLELAQEILLDKVQAGQQRRTPLESCWQRVLAEEITAGGDFPPFDRSPLDGYAVVAAEVQTASADRPVILKVVDNIPAGCTSTETIGLGLAARIMTGAPMPPGATGVVRSEDTRAEGGQVAILDGTGVAGNICRQGEEIAAGEKIVAAGAVINMGIMGMLALLGFTRPRVYRRPKVAILATGSEIVPAGAPLTRGTIRNSNSYMLSAQVAETGAEPVLLGIAGDDVGQIAGWSAKYGRH